MSNDKNITSILQCMSTNQDISRYPWMWRGGSIGFIAFFTLLFLYGLIPIIKFSFEFKTLSTLNRTARICFIVALGLKVLMHSLSFIHWKPEQYAVAGLLIYNLTSYFITTCYTLVLISWITICMQILPLKIVKIFGKAKVCLVVYNVVIYVLYVFAIVVEIISLKPLSAFSAFYDITRDILLAIIYIAFIILLERGLRDDTFAESNLEQKKLLRLVIFLSLMLLARGSISLTQILIHNQVCSIPFFVAVCFSEIVVEGIPLFILLRINNGFLGTKRKMSFDLGTTSLTEA